MIADVHSRILSGCRDLTDFSTAQTTERLILRRHSKRGLHVGASVDFRDLP